MLSPECGGLTGNSHLQRHVSTLMNFRPDTDFILVDLDRFYDVAGTSLLVLLVFGQNSPSAFRELGFRLGFLTLSLGLVGVPTRGIRLPQSPPAVLRLVSVIEAVKPYLLEI